VTNAEARFNKSLRPRKPEGSLWRTAQDVHLDSHTAPELWHHFIVVVDRFYMALFSALEQTHCARMWFLNSDLLETHFWISSTEVVYLQHALFGCYMAGATWNCCRLSALCVHHTTMHYVTSLHAKPHTQGPCVFSCSLPLALLTEWPGSFTCYSGNTGVERIP